MKTFEAFIVETTDLKTKSDVFNHVVNKGHLEGLPWKKKQEILAKAREAHSKGLQRMGPAHNKSVPGTNRGVWGEGVEGLT